MRQLYSRTFDEMISVGTSCRARYQLSLNAHRRAGRSEPFGVGVAHEQGNTHFFDWIVSRPRGILKCLENEFEGVFARENLIIGEHSLVHDREHEFRFDHAFELEDNKVTPAALEAGYEEQKSKFDYLARKFLATKASSKRLLYVLSMDEDDPETAARIARALQMERRPGSTYLLQVYLSPDPKGWVYEDEWMAAYEMSDVIAKPAERKWEGDDEQWSELLDPIRLSGASRPNSRLEALLVA